MTLHVTKAKWSTWDCIVTDESGSKVADTHLGSFVRDSRGTIALAARDGAPPQTLTVTRQDHTWVLYDDQGKRIAVSSRTSFFRSGLIVTLDGSGGAAAAAVRGAGRTPAASPPRWCGAGGGCLAAPLKRTRPSPTPGGRLAVWARAPAWAA